MKKPLLLTGLLLGSLVLTGCKSKAPVTTDSTTSPSTDTPQTGSLTDKMKSWADAASIGGGLKCSFTSTRTPTPVDYVVKGKKLHMKGVTTATAKDKQANTGEMIVDGSFVYTWDSATKVGMKMAVPTQEELKKVAPNTPDFTSEESLKKLEEDGYKIDCAPGIVSDAEFVPPTDVEFKDYTSMMQDSMKKAQEGMSDEQKKQIQDAMKKYAQ